MARKIRTKSIEIRLAEDELQALQDMKGEGGTLARFVREKLLQDCTNLEKQRAVATYAETVYQLKKIGVNVNQIAFQLNSHQATNVEVLTGLRLVLADLRLLADSRVDEVLR